MTTVEPFVNLAAKAHSAQDIEKAILSALECPDLYTFGELVDLNEVQQYSKSSPHIGALLQLFAFGTYGDYKRIASSLSPLTPNLLRKLKQITILQLASEHSRLPFGALRAQLDLQSQSELETLLMELINGDALYGKFDEQKQCFEVERCIAMDIPLTQLASVESELQKWCESCTAMLQYVSQTADTVDNQRKQHLTALQKMKADEEKIRDTLLKKDGHSEKMEVDGNEVEGGKRSILTGSAKIRPKQPARKTWRSGLFK